MYTVEAKPPLLERRRRAGVVVIMGRLIFAIGGDIPRVDFDVIN